MAPPLILWKSKVPGELEMVQVWCVCVCDCWHCCAAELSHHYCDIPLPPHRIVVVVVFGNGSVRVCVCVCASEDQTNNFLATQNLVSIEIQVSLFQTDGQ